jgi:prepilin-type N-terminal cleavage/methylation domain-containing protein
MVESVMNRRAFTLIELLIVIAIIAVLLTILAPALHVAKEMAKGAVCLGNQRILGSSYVMYAQENKTRLPCGYVSQRSMHLPTWCRPPLDANGAYYGEKANLPTPTLENRHWGIRAGAIYTYTQNVEAYHCPGDKRLHEGTSEGNGPEYHAYRSYALPDGLVACNAADDIDKDNLSVPQEKVILKLDTLMTPEEKYTFGEEPYDMPGGQAFNHGSWSFDPYRNLWEWWDPAGSFHNNGLTLSFADGHAIRYKWKDERSIIFHNNRNDPRLGDDPRYQLNNPDILWFVKHYPMNGVLHAN